MGLFGSIWKGVKGVGKVVGSVAKKAAPLAAFIPGVGPLAAAGIGAGASLLGGAASGQGLDVKGALLSGALAGGGKAAMSKAAPLAGAANSAGKSGLLAGALDFVKKNPSLVLGAVQTLNAGNQQKNANAAREKAVAAFAPQPFSFGNSGNPYAGGGMIPARAAALRSLQSVTGG